MGGILPFGCIFIQLFFILNSIWYVHFSIIIHSIKFNHFRAHQYYYFFGFLMVVYIILIITCSETTILLCYFHLCAEVSWPCRFERNDEEKKTRRCVFIGLQLVVAIIFNIRLYRCLFLFLFCLLFRDKIRNLWWNINISLFWLYINADIYLIFIYR